MRHVALAAVATLPEQVGVGPNPVLPSPNGFVALSRINVALG